MLVLKLSKFASKQFYIVLIIAFLSAIIEAFTYFWILFLTDRLGIIEIQAFESFGSISIFWVIILTSGTAVLRFVLPAIQQFWLHHFYAKFSNNFAKLFIESKFKKNDGEHVHFITLMTTKLKPIVNSFFLGFVGLINCTLIILTYVTVLIYMGVIDFIVVCYFVVSFLIIVIPLSKVVSYCSIIIRNNMNIQASFVDNLWKNLHQIISSKQLKSYLSKHQLNEYAIRRADQANQYLAQLFKILVDAVLLFTLLYLILQNNALDISNFLVSIITLQRLLPYFSQMQNYLVTHKSAYGIAKEYQIDEKLSEGAKDLLYRSRTDQFEELSIITGDYSWKPNSKIHIMNFKITRGSKIGLTGQSGVGKSTFIKSLLGLNEFLQGDVRINSMPASYPFLGGYKVSYLNQEGDLITGSVLDNLRTMECISDKDYILRISKLLKDLGLPYSDETYGLGVQKLSGGQQQRVRVLNAAISNCDIVVFDEATSALDKDSVHKVLEVLKSEAFRDKTIIFISHDTSVLNQMDMIYTIDANAISLQHPLS
jgi:ABC-type bacteriocin/lantibiotic exporter with double-glycine peptidase domain